MTFVIVLPLAGLVALLVVLALDALRSRRRGRVHRSLHLSEGARHAGAPALATGSTS